MDKWENITKGTVNIFFLLIFKEKESALNTKYYLKGSDIMV